MKHRRSLFYEEVCVYVLFFTALGKRIKVGANVQSPCQWQGCQRQGLLRKRCRPGSSEFDQEALPQSLAALIPKRPATETLEAWQGSFSNHRRRSYSE